MRYIRILHIISGNDNGGGGNYVLNLCNNKEYNFESSIGCMGKGQLYDKAVKNKVMAKVFDFKSVFNGQIVKYIKENNIEIVNLHGAKPFFMYYFLKNKISVPCIATVHSDFRYDFTNNKFKYIFYTPLSIMGLKKFRYFIPVSCFIEKLLLTKNFKGKMCIINNGIDLKDMVIKKTRMQVRKECNIDEDDFLFVVAARFHPVKNHERLIEAFYRISKEYDNVKLMLIGDGEDELKIKDMVVQKKIDKNVIFTGFKSDVIDYMAASDITMLVSINEGGAPPLVILESAAVNKPVIYSNVGGMEGTIDDQFGFKVDPLKVDDIYDSMKKAYINKAKLHEMGIKFHDFVRDNYSASKVHEKYYNYCKSILSENK